jgi:hypothetical protein
MRNRQTIVESQSIAFRRVCYRPWSIHANSNSETVDSCPSSGDIGPDFHGAASSGKSSYLLSIGGAFVRRHDEAADLSARDGRPGHPIKQGETQCDSW